MPIIQSLPIIFSFLLLAAHFFRGNHLALVTISLLMPMLLFIPRRWSARVVQCALMIGTLEWMRTALILVQDRMDAGEPYARLAIILGTISFATCATAFSFRWTAMKRRYHCQQKPSADAP